MCIDISVIAVVVFRVFDNLFERKPSFFGELAERIIDKFDAERTRKERAHRRIAAAGFSRNRNAEFPAVFDFIPCHTFSLYFLFIDYY